MWKGASCQSSFTGLGDDRATHPTAHAQSYYIKRSGTSCSCGITLLRPRRVLPHTAPPFKIL